MHLPFLFAARIIITRRLLATILLYDLNKWGP
jgi:hypothetical protein